jgi:CRISPR/Cas system-associated protein endoribonuclease Cas2
MVANLFFLNLSLVLVKMVFEDNKKISTFEVFTISTGVQMAFLELYKRISQKKQEKQEEES